MYQGLPVMAAPPSAYAVGDAFVKQYYNVLYHSTQLAHRFYTDASWLSRAEVHDQVALPVSTLTAIHEKIVSFPQGDSCAEIKSMDAQDTLGGGVVVMVTGVQPCLSGDRQKFVQTFFLAPQEKGFFVLNDMLRFLGEDESQLPTAEPSVAPLPPLPTVHSGNGISNALEAFHCDEAVEEKREYNVQEHASRHVNPPELDQFAGDQFAGDQFSGDQFAGDNAFPAVATLQEEFHSATISEPPPPPPPVEVPTEKRKLSYASILRVASEPPSASLAHFPEAFARSTPPPAVNAHAQVNPRSAGPPAPSSNPQGDGSFSSASYSEGDGKSVYVKNLPLNVTMEELEMEFGKFGPLVTNGINLRNEKPGVCFAFVEFEDPSSARNAINASPILMRGREVYVEERKSMTAPQAGRGGGSRPSRGRGGYQGNGGTQGRDSYGGGRGYGRGSGQNSDRDFNRGRGNGGRRGVAY